MDAARLDVSQAFGDLGIDDSALLGSVLVVRGRELRTDANHAAGDLKHYLLATLKASLPAYGRRDHKRCFAFDGDGRGSSTLDM